MAKYIIKVKNANVYLGDNLVLRDINWQVKRGEHWFILGANGAGKTTLVKLLMGYVWPLFGASIQVMGRQYGEIDLAEIRRHLAWVSPGFQQYASLEWTGMEMVISGIDGTLGLFRKPLRAEKTLAKKVMLKLGCFNVSERKMKQMSSGEQVRIMISRALICNPAILILDEACMHLDFKGREMLLDTLDRLAGEKDTTIIFITHRLEEILPVFGHGMIMRDGMIVASGTREKIITTEVLQKTFEININLCYSANGRIWPMLD